MTFKENVEKLHVFGPNEGLKSYLGASSIKLLQDSVDKLQADTPSRFAKLFGKKEETLSIYEKDVLNFINIDFAITKKLANFSTSLPEKIENSEREDLDKLYNFLENFYLLRWTGYNSINRVTQQILTQLQTVPFRMHLNILRVIFNELPKKYYLAKQNKLGVATYYRVRKSNSNTDSKVQSLQKQDPQVNKEPSYILRKDVQGKYYFTEVLK